jgi:hypothetical protein
MKTLDKASFSRIRIGMTLAQVNAIVGTNGVYLKDLTETKNGVEYVARFYVWMGGNEDAPKIISAVIYNGQVTNAYSSGL